VGLGAAITTVSNSRAWRKPQLGEGLLEGEGPAGWGDGQSKRRFLLIRKTRQLPVFLAAAVKPFTALVLCGGLSLMESSGGFLMA